MQDFTRLRVWRLAHELRLAIYAATRGFPVEERYGLTAQIRRSAASVPTNISEACGYSGGADSARFVQIALGSCCETLNHLLAARDLGYLSVAEFEKLAEQLAHVRAMSIRLMQRMRSSKPGLHRPKRMAHST